MVISTLNIKLIKDRLGFINKAILEYKGIANALGESGVITEDHSSRLRLMAGYRNRLVHFYSEVSDKELLQILKNNISDIEEFVMQIKLFIEKYKEHEKNTQEQK